MRQQTSAFLFVVSIFHLENHIYTFILYIETHYNLLASAHEFNELQTSRAEQGSLLVNLNELNEPSLNKHELNEYELNEPSCSLVQPYAGIV